MNPGVSGGPVVNLRGEVIGVAISSLRTGQQVNFASPGAAVKDLLDGLAGRPVAELPRLRTPMTGSSEVPLQFDKGVSAGSSGTELGVVCTTPPARARAITAVRGNLNVPGNLLAATWLSLRRGVEGNSQEAFGLLYHDNRFQPELRDRRLSVSVGTLDGPPEPVCLNYTYRTPTVCMNCRFQVKYAVEYRVLAITAP
jgi:hypothetical protein